MTYLITFACYGCHLHGDAAGSVDPAHNTFGAPLLEKNPVRVAFEEQRLDQNPYYLSEERRDAVLSSILEVCAHRGWILLAAHVRSTHVHTVVEAEVPPERIMNCFKAYASRRLNLLPSERSGLKRWARHGSTRRLWKAMSLFVAGDM